MEMISEAIYLNSLTGMKILSRLVFPVIIGVEVPEKTRGLRDKNLSSEKER